MVASVFFRRIPRLALLLMCFAGGGVWGQSLSLDFNSPGQFTTNFNYPGGGSPCTETDGLGVQGSRGLQVTGGDGNATFKTSSWDFSTNGASVTVSLMIHITQAANTTGKFQLGILNSNSVGFANNAAGWQFGSFRLLPQSTAVPTYQLAVQEKDGATLNSANVGGVITLAVGHWYQFNVGFTNTSPGKSYAMDCSLLDYGLDGATPGANLIAFSALQSVTGSFAVLAADNAVWPGFRVGAGTTGIDAVDNFNVLGGGGGNSPVITAQPANQTCRQTDPATFTVTAAGTLPLTFQWRSNGVPIAGATAAGYTTPPVTPGMSGTAYSVVVSNGLGAVLSSNASLRVLPSPGGTLVWSDEFDGPTLDTAKWAPQSYLRTPQFSPPGYWVAEDAYLSGQGQLVLRVAYDPATGRYGSGALQGKYQRAFGYFEAKMKFPTQPGHWCAFWLFTMSQGSTNAIGGSDGAEIDIMERAWLTDHVQHALHWDGYGAGSGSAGQQVRGLGMNDGGWHIFGVDWTPTNYNFYVDGALTWSTNAGGVCQVPDYVLLTEEIGNYGVGPEVWGTSSITNAALPDYTLVDYVRIYEAAPYITNPPVSQSVIAGGNAGFAVGASGTPPLAYQWRFNGANIAGATASSFTRTNAQPPEAGNYTVVVTDVAGSVTSAPTALAVLGPPVLLAPAVAANGGFSFLLGGDAGCNYSIESATNLLSPDWVPVATLTNASRVAPFAETNRASLPSRFYRARLLP